MKALTVALCIVGLCVWQTVAITSLQQAFYAAFNARVQDGTWTSVIGYPSSGLFGGNLCLGDLSDAEYPEVEEGTDLAYVLQTGQFICGYNSNLKQYASDGQVLLDTTGPTARGKIVDLFAFLGISISAHYGPQVNVVWNTNLSTTNAVLNAVINGTFDAACGALSPGASFVYEGETVPRAYYMSLFQCFTYFQPPLMTTLSGSNVGSFADVITAIETADQSSTTFRICTTGSPEGGLTQTCTGTIIQYVSGYSCTGLGTQAYRDLNSGYCDAVWGNPPTATPTDPKQYYVSFNAPVVASQGTFFRPDDIHSAAAAARPTAAAIVAVLVAVWMAM
jgi:hypothetical protein